MKDLFIGFLKENNVYDEFIDNLSKQNERLTLDEFYADEEYDGFLDTLISDAFTWSQTEKFADSDESHAYWSELNNKWELLIKQQQENEKND